jgi:hypothetical protein
MSECGMWNVEFDNKQTKCLANERASDGHLHHGDGVYTLFYIRKMNYSLEYV